MLPAWVSSNSITAGPRAPAGRPRHRPPRAARPAGIANLALPARQAYRQATEVGRGRWLAGQVPGLVGILGQVEQLHAILANAVVGRSVVTDQLPATVAGCPLHVLVNGADLFADRA